MFNKNVELHRKMVEAGCEYLEGEEFKGYVDSEGRHVSYPIGFIQGPFNRVSDDSKLTRPWIVAVKIRDGHWEESMFRSREGAAIWSADLQRRVFNSINYEFECPKHIPFVETKEVV